MHACQDCWDCNLWGLLRGTGCTIRQARGITLLRGQCGQRKEAWTLMEEPDGMPGQLSRDISLKEPSSTLFRSDVSPKLTISWWHVCEPDSFRDSSRHQCVNWRVTFWKHWQKFCIKSTSTTEWSGWMLVPSDRPHYCFLWFNSHSCHSLVCLYKLRVTFLHELSDWLHELCWLRRPVLVWFLSQKTVWVRKQKNIIWLCQDCYLSKVPVGLRQDMGCCRLTMRPLSRPSTLTHARTVTMSHRVGTHCIAMLCPDSTEMRLNLVSQQWTAHHHNVNCRPFLSRAFSCKPSSSYLWLTCQQSETERRKSLLLHSQIGALWVVGYIPKLIGTLLHLVHWTKLALSPLPSMLCIKVEIAISIRHLSACVWTHASWSRHPVGFIIQLHWACQQSLCEQSLFN